MATLANIVINDGQSTPVAHTFEPARRVGNSIEWHDRASGVLAGFNRIMLTSVAPKKLASGVYRVTVKVMAPTLAVTAPSSGTGIQPNPVAAYFTESIHTFNIPAASTADARKTARLYAIGALSNAQIVDAIDKLAPPVV
ncbi:MAG: hypothetical protein [Sanya fiers-like virus 55]|nr:MAG: hypothetical protein [Sanya fiers-like virus 55]